MLALASVCALVSCSNATQVPNLGDPATADQPEAAAFIADTELTEEDVRILKSLRDHLFDIWLDATVPAGGSREPLRPDDYIEKVQSDWAWPGEEAGWDTTDQSGNNPRVIARISQLALKEIAAEHPENWTIIGFDYPEGSYSPFYVPVGEDEYVSVTAKCLSGMNEGAIIEVRYYRWLDGRFDMSFVTTVEDAARNEELRDRVADLPSLRGHRVDLGYNGYVYVTECNDAAEKGYPLRKAETLNAILGELASQGGEDFGVIAPSGTIHLCVFEDSLFHLEYAGRTTDSATYRVDLPSAHVVAMALRNSDGDKTIELIAHPCEDKAELEEIVGYAIDVPERIRRNEPRRWEYIESQDWDSDEPNPPMACVRYGGSSHPIAIVVLGDTPFVESTCEDVLVPRNAYNRNRTVLITDSRSIEVGDCRGGTAMTFYEADDEDRQYVAYVTEDVDDDELADIAESTHLR